jgi:predicted transcriptional regulator of viral defense system
LNELQSVIDKSEASIKSELSRLIEKKVIVNLRKGFYLIIPPRYSRQGQVPIQLYIEKLFKHLNRNYYLGFYSAAKFHGASHQQTQRDYLMTETPKLNDIKKNTFDIRFLTTSKWSNKNILDRKSDAGIFKISSPALTAVDLIHHQSKLGGMNRMLAILGEIAEEITQNDIAELLTWYPNKSTLQRFGFLLEEVNADQELSNQIKKYLKKSRYFPVLLSPKTGQKPGAVDNFWKVAINIKLESDL